jgi:hypothetical protein
MLLKRAPGRWQWFEDRAARDDDPGAPARLKVMALTISV